MTSAGTASLFSRSGASPTATQRNEMSRGRRSTPNGISKSAVDLLHQRAPGIYDRQNGVRLLRLQIEHYARDAQVLIALHQVRLLLREPHGDLDRIRIASRF